MAYNLSNEVYSGDGRGDSPRSGPELDEHNESGNLSDKPVFLLEHLATFTVNEESGILYPSDGMRKLLQLEKTTGIWSQKMQLCLDRQWVLIMDYETGNIIERFPATLIQEPTAFTSNDPMEMYNNILVFIVGGESSRSEMHIFQCQGISAIHLVEDLKALRSGKMVAKYWDPLPQQQNKEKEPSASKLAINRGPPQISAADYYHQQDTDSDLGGLNDDTSSTSSEKYERDVTVLNHCFDDIEKFIARLQHAAAASRELERRRRSRRSKKKDPGEGLLTLRTRPPHEKEFIDIFAKFKLSFNLLAKLKAHIHDPNAPELVHFLFTPLALIVDASHDTYYDPNLPARVIKPLLTREAINLLINCVTSKETELWRSLGDAWTIPRDQWKGNVAPYHPVFFDGWSPDYPVVDELEMSSLQLKGGRRSVNASAGQSSDYNVDYDFESAPAITTTGVMNVPPPGSPVIRDFSTRSEISIDSIERNGGPSATIITSAMVANASGERERDREMGRNAAIASNSSDMGNDTWLEELKARNAKIVQVTYPRTANNDKELTVVRGEFLEVMDDTRKWWKARNSRGNIAHVPHTIVTQYPYTDTASNPNSGNDILYNQQAPPQNYNKNRVSSEENPHNVMPADWVRNKHLGHENVKEAQVKTGAFSYASTKSDRSSYDGDAWYQQHQQQQQQITSTNFMVAAANQSAIRNSKYSHNMNDENNNNNINNNSNHINNNVQKHINKPPPPPPLPASNSSTLKSVKSVNLNTLTRNDKNNNNNNNNISNGTASNQSTITRQSSTNSFSQKQNQQVGDMQEELKQVLTLFKERRRNLDIIKTPEIFITQKSTPSEVEQWLVGKQFSESIVKKLKGLNGNELLALSKNTLEEYCGVDEGRRLASQITLQKANNKYNTARSSELQAILARARLKTEQSA